MIVESRVGKGFVSKGMNFGNRVALQTIFASFSDDEFSVFGNFAATFETD